MDRTIGLDGRKRWPIPEMALLAAIAFALACQIALTVLLFIEDMNVPAIRIFAVAVFAAGAFSFFCGMALRAVYGRRFGIVAQVVPMPFAAFWALLYWTTTVHWTF